MLCTFRSLSWFFLHKDEKQISELKSATSICLIGVKKLAKSENQFSLKKVIRVPPLVFMHVANSPHAKHICLEKFLPYKKSLWIFFKIYFELFTSRKKCLQVAGIEPSILELLETGALTTWLQKLELWNVSSELGPCVPLIFWFKFQLKMV